MEEYSSAKKNDTLNRDSVETAKLNFFEDYRVSKKLLVPIDENAIEIDMMERIAFHGKTVASLLEEANIPDNLHDNALQILTNLELSTIINMFSSKGKASFYL